MPNILAFTTLDESGFLVFGVSNAKYLTFDTPDRNALNVSHGVELVSLTKKGSTMSLAH